MPEPYYVFCAVCEQSYDKWETPTCPRCSEPRAPKKKAAPRKAPAAEKAPRPPSTPARSAAGSLPGVAKDRPVTAAAAARSVEAMVRDDASGQYSFVQSAPLWGAAGLALGLLVYPIAVNTVLQRPLLEAPVVERLQRAEIVSAGRAEPEAAGPTEIRVVLDEVSLAVTDWRREPGETDGTVKYVGSAENVSKTQIADSLVQLIARDLAGRELVKGWSWLSPAMLRPGESGSFEVEMAVPSATATIEVKASWNQHFRADLEPIDPQAASRYFSENRLDDDGAAPAASEPPGSASAGSGG